MKNQYQPIDEKDVMYLATSEPIILHIKYLLTFYFDCYFHSEKSNVEKLCSKDKNPFENQNISNIHLPHIFDFKEEKLQKERPVYWFH